MSLRVTLPLVRVKTWPEKPARVNSVSVLMIMELAVRLPFKRTSGLEPNPLANCTSLVEGGMTSPAQLAAVDQFQSLPPPPSQMLTAASAGGASSATIAAAALASEEGILFFRLLMKSSSCDQMPRL